MAISQRVPARLRKLRVGPWILGIDEKTESHEVGARKCRDAQNLLLDEKPGLAVKRNGSRLLSLLPSGLPARDVFVFSRTDGVSFLLASDGATLFFTSDPTSQAAWTSLKTGLNSDGFMEFETAEDKVWMTNGIDPVMSWDGTTLRTYDREFQSITDATSITTTTVAHTGLTDADDFWNGQTIVFTAGTNAGTRATVTDFVAATDTITFSPALPNAPAVTDRFKVGLIIPKARAIRNWDGHMWLGSTTDNLSEARFHRLTDPSTGADIDIDDPLAWPPTFQLDINSADGDRVWGITPILRDRIVFFKSTGMFRIERDPLTTYRFEVLEKAVGSRFQRSFAEKKELLYFFGQDKDGLPDIFKTDMVNVRPVDPLGGLEPTLRQLRQPNAVQRSVAFSTQSEFDSGTKSSNVKTSGGIIEPDKLDTLVKWQAILQAGSNIDIESNPGKPGVLGYPIWTDDYDPAVSGKLPQNDTPAWTKNTDGGNVSDAITAGELVISTNPTSGNALWYVRDSVIDSAKDTLFIIRCKDTTGGAGDPVSFVFQLGNGSRAVAFKSEDNALFDLISGANLGSTTTFKTYVVLLKSNNSYKLWIDGVLSSSGTAQAASLDRIMFGFGSLSSVTGDPNLSKTASDGAIFQKVAWHNDFKGDILSSQGNKISPTSLPDTLPTSGDITVQNDYTRIPTAQRRIHASITLNNGTAQPSSFTSDTVDFSTGNDPAGFVDFTNGAVPTSLVKQFQRVKYAFTLSTGAKEGPIVTDVKQPILWLSPNIFIGSNIAAWRTFLATLTTPAGTDQEIRIRETTVATNPVEGDFAAFKLITSGDNIGTILSDGTPPTTRNVQIMIEQGPDSAGLLPLLDSFIVQWNEGAADILPLHGIVHKKRYLAAAANGTSSANDIIIINDRNEAWMKYVGNSVNAMVHFKGLLLGFSSIDDKILELDVEGLFIDQAAAIDAFLDTREEKLADEALRKDFRYGVLHLGTITGTLNVLLKRVSDSAFTGSKTVTLAGKGLDRRINFPTATITKRIQRRYRNNVANESMELSGETLYYALRSQLPNGG